MSSKIQNTTQTIVNPQSRPKRKSPGDNFTKTADTSSLNKKLPLVIKNKISGNLPYTDLQNMHLVCRSWTKILPNELNLGNSNPLIERDLTEKEIIDIIKTYPKELTTISLSFNISDAVIKEIAKLENLKELNLSECYELTDASLKEIGKMKTLNVLKLSQCFRVTHDGLKEISKLQNLIEFYLTKNSTTNKDLQEIFKFKKLKLLNLSQSPNITSLEEIYKMKNLKELNLRDCFCISEESLTGIFKLPNLRELNLSNCIQIHDDLLQQLVKDRQLKYQREVERYLNEGNILGNNTLFPKSENSSLHNIIADYVPLPIEITTSAHA